MLWYISKPTQKNGVYEPEMNQCVTRGPGVDGRLNMLLITIEEREKIGREDLKKGRTARRNKRQ